jgi:hypothetical protein
MEIDYEKGMDGQPDASGGAVLKFDPSNVRGMEDFQSGDKVSATIDFTMGDVGEDGQVEVTLNRIVAEPMNQAKKMGRGMMGMRKPSTEGTNIKMGDE